jgi:hypothetical protein
MHIKGKIQKDSICCKYVNVLVDYFVPKEIAPLSSQPPDGLSWGHFCSGGRWVRVITDHQQDRAVPTEAEATTKHLPSEAVTGVHFTSLLKARIMQGAEGCKKSQRNGPLFIPSPILVAAVMALYNFLLGALTISVSLCKKKSPEASIKM